MNKVKNKYSFGEIIALALSLIRSKLLNRRIRLIRYPIDIRGKKYIDFGQNLTTGKRCRFDVFGGDISEKKLIFGRNVQLNDAVHIVCMKSINIGNNVLMASHIFISDNSHGSYKGDNNDTDPNTPPIERHYFTAPIKIGDNTWIGEGVVIMPGVTIGNGCVIGAHSIVNKSIPDYTIAVGIPAKVVKKYNFNLKRWERYE